MVFLRGKLHSVRTPRPNVADDPLYAVRLAVTGMLAYAAVALPVGLIAAQRKAFDPVKASAGPISMIVLVYVMAWTVEELRPMPLVYIGAMWFAYFVGFRMILQTGAQAGMLIVIVTVLMSVMGMHGSAIVETMRDGFVQASLVAALLAPLVYALFPARTTERHIDQPVPEEGNVTTGAVIRATVLMGLTFWLYSVMQPADMMMAVVAAMVLVFPTRRAVFFEATQRIRATCCGSVIATLVLAVFAVVPHLPILLGVLFVGGLWAGDRMLHGQHPSMVYQYALSVAMALVAGALSTQDAGYAIFTRIVLTLAGALTATIAVGLLDALSGWRQDIESSPESQQTFT